MRLGDGEADNYALEEALRLKEKHGGDVVVLSMGGEEAARVLRSGLAMGADRAIHLLDPKFKGADEFAAAATLAKAIEKDGGADLVLAGVQSDDLGTGMTGTMLAEFLGSAHATVVVIPKKRITVSGAFERRVEAGKTVVAQENTVAFELTSGEIRRLIFKIDIALNVVIGVAGFADGD